MVSCWIFLSFLAIALVLLALVFLASRRRHKSTMSRRRCPEPVATTRLVTPKPPWVRDEVLRLKALMPHNGCRKIAATFNHMYRQRQVSVGKSFVANVLKAEGHRLAQVHREIRRRRPRLLPKNVLWGLDLTFVREDDDNRPVLGLIDHGTRACMALRTLPSKSSVTILRVLLDVVEQFGKPMALRTDNESIFTSALFRLGLTILSIRHQRTAPFAPWQNGRIERLFGTFKQMLRQTADLAHDPQTDLNLFRTWYNHVRPHQSLDGFTPAQVWNRNCRTQRHPWFFSAWDGVLTGFYFPS